MKQNHKLNVTLLPLQGHLYSSDKLGEKALEALSSIAGVTEVKIECESNNSVSLSYTWTGLEDFQFTDECLKHFGFSKRWEKM